MLNWYIEYSISYDIWNRIYDDGTLIYEEFIKENPEKAFYSRDGVAKFTYNGNKMETYRARALTVFREIEKIPVQVEQDHWIKW